MAMPYLHATETKLLLQVKADLERHEGFREFAYPDPLSVLYKQHKSLAEKWGNAPAGNLLDSFDEDQGKPWTVGFGFTLGVNSESRMDRIKAERMLEEKIFSMRDMLADKLPWFEEASTVTQGVLINMGFNMGVVGLLKFKNTLAQIKEQNYKQAAANMRKSLWFSQVGKRASELSNRIETQTIEQPHKAKERL